MNLFSNPSNNLFGNQNQGQGANLFANNNQPQTGTNLFSNNQQTTQNSLFQNQQGNTAPQTNLFAQPNQNTNLFQNQNNPTNTLCQNMGLNQQSNNLFNLNNQQNNQNFTLQQAQQQQKIQTQIDQLGNVIAMHQGIDSKQFKSADLIQMQQLYFSKFCLQFGNHFQDKLVKELQNQQYKQKICEYQLSLDENEKQKRFTESHLKVLEKNNDVLQDQIQKISKEIIQLKNQQQQLQVMTDQLRKDMDLYAKINNDFYHFCNFLRQDLNFPSIQIPSPFLNLVQKKISDSISGLKYKVQELQDLFNANFEKDQKEDYDIALKIMNETLIYFQNICSQVFSNHFEDFKRSKSNSFYNMGITDINSQIQKNLNNDQQKDQNTQILNNIIEQIQQKKQKLQ